MNDAQQQQQQPPQHDNNNNFAQPKINAHNKSVLTNDP